MRILVLNPGSSTLKYRLVAQTADESRTVTDGILDRVPGDAMAEATRTALARCRAGGIDAVGCRVVHGGAHFAAPTPVTAEVLAAIRALGKLAPLHNPGAVAVLETLRRELPDTPLVAVFDTAFHRTIPEPAALYPLPLELSHRLALRRYGFHGISHRYVAGRVIERLARGGGPTRVITCHLGNGCSVCAVRDGRSIDTSMGLTPLEGLMMGTRAGDVDPGLLLHLLREETEAAPSLDQLLNHESGLLGVAGSNDMRDVQTRADGGDERAALALDMFTYRIRKYIGAYAAALEGIDALAFSGGIGEHSAVVRRRVCEPLAWLGVRFDAERNEQPGPGEVCLTLPDSPVQVWRIPTDEERLIAAATVEVLGLPG